METVFATYTTQTEADLFVRTFNMVNGRGRTAVSVRVGPGEYQVSIKECPTWEEFFFPAAKRAA